MRLALLTLLPHAHELCRDLRGGILYTFQQGGAVQAISLLASMLNTAAAAPVSATPSATDGTDDTTVLSPPFAPPPPVAPPLVGAALAEQEQLRNRMIGMLEDSVPTTASSSSDKKAHAQVRS